ncbi:MAG: molybdopterin molybdotransferase MoeA [Actinomycetota bacterium]|nr:molybdopterin molybdotransferase MoeA [Actinomycetota bacterium]
MPEFFKVASPQQIFDSLAGFAGLALEQIDLEHALGRVLGRDIISQEELPPRARSTMDGYAVRAENTFGASDAVPALLKIAGRVAMGSLPDISVSQGQAAEIPTGGFLPEGADAVVMVEYTNPLGNGEIEVTRPVARGDNVLERAGDVTLGEIVLPAGRRLRPQDVGMLAGLGVTEITVFKKPRVAIVSTGDEIIPVTETPSPGQIRDINSYAISALVESVGGLPVTCEIVRDEPDLLKSALANALEMADVVVISGGSSVGERDHIVEVVNSFPLVEIHAHGIAISPGKPTLLAGVQGKPVFGLPGHPVSAIVVAQVFLLPFLKYLEGEELKKEPIGRQVRAVLATSVHSPHGREEYTRVKLERERDGLVARPVFGKSGMMSTLVKADGFFVIPIHAEGVAAGETIDVYLF